MSLLKLFLVALLLQGTANPRLRTGSIEGIVMGSSGEALPKVTVTLTEIIGEERLARASALNLVTPTTLAEILAIASSVSIRISGIPQRSATTGPDGKFVFENVPATLFLLQAERQGYVSTQYGQKSPNGKAAPLILTPGQKVKNVRFVMTTDGAVTGRIVDRNGEPVSRARVQALQNSYSTPEGRSLTVVESVTTNDMGEYRLFWLPPGAYFISAVPLDIQVSSFSLRFQTQNTSPAPNFIWDPVGTDRNSNSFVSSQTLKDGTVVEEAPVPVFYPGVFAAKQAMPVVVRPGTTISGINITAAPARVYRIRGVTINGTTGLPQSMSMALIPRDGFSGAILNMSIRSSATGTFEITGVVPGSYLLAASDVNLGGLTLIEVGNTDVSNVTLTAGAPLTLKGRLTVDGAALPALARPVRLSLTLRSLVPQLPSVTTEIAADGTFAFEGNDGIFAGDYQVVPQNLNAFVKSIRLGSQDVLMDGLHIRSQPEGQLDITVCAAIGVMEGRVVDERHEPVSNATVVVFPDPPFLQLNFTTTTDAAGKFQFGALPGRYKVYAWEDVAPRAWLDSDFLRSSESHGRLVTLSSGGAETVEVPVIPYVP